MAESPELGEWPHELSPLNVDDDGGFEFRRQPLVYDCVSNLPVFRILTLTLKKVPFHLILNGLKDCECRRPSASLLSRLYDRHGAAVKYTHIRFARGHGAMKPRFLMVLAGVSWGPVHPSYPGGIGFHVSGNGEDVLHFHLGAIVRVARPGSCYY